MAQPGYAGNPSLLDRTRRVPTRSLRSHDEPPKLQRGVTMLPTEGPRFRDTRGRTRVLFDTTLETRASPSAPRGFGASQSVRPVGVEATEENLDSCVQTRRGSRADPGSVSRRITTLRSPSHSSPHHVDRVITRQPRCYHIVGAPSPRTACIRSMYPPWPQLASRRHPSARGVPIIARADRERVGITRESTDGRGCRVGERRASGRGGRRRHRRGHRRALVRGAPRRPRGVRAENRVSSRTNRTTIVCVARM